MPTYPRRCDFGAILDSRGFQEWPLWAPFSPKKAPKVEYPSWLGAPWSQPGREMAPKTSQNDPRIEFNRFFNEFGLIWDRFSMKFSWFLTCVSIIVCVLFWTNPHKHSVKDPFWNVRLDPSFRTFYFWSFSYHILKCPFGPLLSDILLLIIQLSHLEM